MRGIGEGDESATTKATRLEFQTWWQRRSRIARLESHDGTSQDEEVPLAIQTLTPSQTLFPEAGTEGTEQGQLHPEKVGIIAPSKKEVFTSTVTFCALNPDRPVFDFTRDLPLSL